MGRGLSPIPVESLPRPPFPRLGLPPSPLPLRVCRGARGGRGGVGEARARAAGRGLARAPLLRLTPPPPGPGGGRRERARGPPRARAEGRRRGARLPQPADAGSRAGGRTGTRAAQRSVRDGAHIPVLGSPASAERLQFIVNCDHHCLPGIFHIQKRAPVYTRIFTARTRL